MEGRGESDLEEGEGERWSEGRRGGGLGFVWPHGVISDHMERWTSIFAICYFEFHLKKKKKNPSVEFGIEGSVGHQVNLQVPMLYCFLICFRFLSENNFFKRILLLFNSLVGKRTFLPFSFSLYLRYTLLLYLYLGIPVPPPCFFSIYSCVRWVFKFIVNVGVVRPRSRSAHQAVSVKW